MREPEAVLEAAARTLDLDRPVGPVLPGALDLVPDAGQAYGIVRRLMDALAPGSHLALSQAVHGQALDRTVRSRNGSGGIPMTLRGQEEVEGFFAGLGTPEPGVVPLPRWRPGPGAPVAGRGAVHVCGVGRKP
ncbi:SAM-dependent methyltransferase [Spirillospora sp. NPDC127200]